MLRTCLRARLHLNIVRDDLERRNCKICTSVRITARVRTRKNVNRL